MQYEPVRTMRREQIQVINFLSKIYAADQVPHALLFTGQDIAGKIALALAFARWLLHGDRGEFSDFSEFYRGECVCAPCQEVKGRIHPDFWFLDDAPVAIERVRTLKRAFALTPFSATRKVALIAHGGTIRTAAANALLKLLEEPMGDSVFILVANARQDVLPTISSRAVEVRFAPQRTALEERYDADLIKRATEAIAAFEDNALGRRFAEAKNYTAQNKAELMSILDVWMFRLRRSLLEASGENICGILRRILDAKERLAVTNANPQLIVEELLLNF